jgi:hypothetical protein
MTLIKRITVSGFRGILSSLTIDFFKGSKCQSAVLYGGNGTGKSSVTDSWEWLTTGKIQHLAREGAEEGAYPHREAKQGGTYVEIEFSDSAIGVVKLQFDQNRVTRPIVTGRLDEARSLITHPCHIRFGDLTRFVFLRKSERYDALASLMGFVPQMEYQKALRRVQTNFEREVAQLGHLKDDVDARFKAHFGLTDVEVKSALKRLSDICKKYGLPTEPTIESTKKSNESLQEVVAKDPKAKQLADYQSLETALRSCTVSSELVEQLAQLRDAAGQVKAAQKENLGTQLMIPLLQAADTLLAKVKPTGQCPLCGKTFDGDLHEHVRNELAKLRHLQELTNTLRHRRETVARTLAAHKEITQTFDTTLDAAKPDINSEALARFRAAAQSTDDCVSRLKNLLTFDSTVIDDELIENLKTEKDLLVELESDFAKSKTALLTEANSRKASVDRDPTRQKLVADSHFLNFGLNLIDELESKTARLKRGREVLAEYNATVDDYVTTCLVDVQKRFDEISEKVKTYFEVLEKHTPELSAPKLKLSTDQDRSVVLEVMFHGATVNPAYKYLSESQLNSFGLAVFLASAIHFNKDCQFLILDDVVNSFDAYKRPLVIELIKNHLKDRQVLLMTHDRFWRELLHRNLPTWQKIDFRSYTYGVGPSVFPGLHTLEKVEDALKRDEPDEACRTLFQYLEDVLQEVTEKFECEVKFNRRNEYTLETLLDRLRVRAADKLKPDHPLTLALTELHNSNAYRNWATHCKNPQSSIHRDEVTEVLTKWRAVESQLFCQDKTCYDIPRYDGKSSFVCGCGKTRLAKFVPPPLTVVK